MQTSALTGAPWLVLVALGAIICAMVFAVDKRVGGVLIFLVVFSMLSYAVAQGKLKGSTP